MGRWTETLDVRVPGHVMYRELDDEAVLLDLHSGRYFGFDEIGMRMWQALLVSSTVTQAVQRLLVDYAADPVCLRGDLIAWLERLTERGLLESRAGIEPGQ